MYIPSKGNPRSRKRNKCARHRAKLRAKNTRRKINKSGRRW